MRKLNVYWYGYGGSSWMAEKLREMIEDDLGMKLVTIHEHQNADIPWKLDTVLTHLKEADIIIVPANYRRQPCKSNNRLTQSMALGKPVICEPMPAYVPIVKNFENAIILKDNSDLEWRNALRVLRDSEVLRNTLSKNALETAKSYSLESIADHWVNALISLDKKGTSQPNKDIDVIIPTKNNIEILDQCLKSFKNSTMTENIYIIDNGEGVEDLVKQYGIPYETKNI